MVALWAIKFSSNSLSMMQSIFGMKTFPSWWADLLLVFVFGRRIQVLYLSLLSKKLEGALRLYFHNKFRTLSPFSSYYEFLNFGTFIFDSGVNVCAYDYGVFLGGN
jgi:hypothetical protein